MFPGDAYTGYHKFWVDQRVRAVVDGARHEGCVRTIIWRKNYGSGVGFFRQGEDIHNPNPMLETEGRYYFIGDLQRWVPEADVCLG